MAYFCIYFLKYIFFLMIFEMALKVCFLRKIKYLKKNYFNNS